MFSLGTTTVIFQAADLAGNSSSATFAVTVQDTTPPFVTTAGDVSANATGPGGAVVSYPNAAAGDLVGVTSLTYSHASGSIFENQRPVDHLDNEVGVRVAEGVLAAIRRDAERPIGLAAGQFCVDARFWEPLDDEMLAAFHGNGP